MEERPSCILELNMGESGKKLFDAGELLVNLCIEVLLPVLLSLLKIHFNKLCDFLKFNLLLKSPYLSCKKELLRESRGSNRCNKQIIQVQQRWLHSKVHAFNSKSDTDTNSHACGEVYITIESIDQFGRHYTEFCVWILQCYLILTLEYYY